jgi:hypothetical protein
MSQPFAVAQVFTGYEGKLVPLKDTVRSFKEILSGQHDSLPESAFYMVYPTLYRHLDVPLNFLIMFSGWHNRGRQSQS